MSETAKATQVQDVYIPNRERLGRVLAERDHLSPAYASTVIYFIVNFNQPHYADLQIERAKQIAGLLGLDYKNPRQIFDDVTKKYADEIQVYSKNAQTKSLYVLAPAKSGVVKAEPAALKEPKVEIPKVKVEPAPPKRKEDLNAHWQRATILGIEILDEPGLRDALISKRNIPTHEAQRVIEFMKIVQDGAPPKEIKRLRMAVDLNMSLKAFDHAVETMTITTMAHGTGTHQHSIRTFGREYPEFIKVTLSQPEPDGAN